jgi:hypothetical protein
MIEPVRIRHLELAFSPRPWPFAEARRNEIASHFDQLKRVKPSIWNGRILLLHDHLIADDVFRGAYFETDYASFVAWRDWGFPDATVRHCFSFGALRGSDGNFLVGVMNSHTLNAGKVVCPARMPDIVSGVVDLAGSVRREVAEETGLHPDAYCPSSGSILKFFSDWFD